MSNVGKYGKFRSMNKKMCYVTYLCIFCDLQKKKKTAVQKEKEYLNVLLLFR